MTPRLCLKKKKQQNTTVLPKDLTLIDHLNGKQLLQQSNLKTNPCQIEMKSEWLITNDLTQI